MEARQIFYSDKFFFRINSLTGVFFQIFDSVKHASLLHQSNHFSPIMFYKKSQSCQANQVDVHNEEREGKKKILINFFSKKRKKGSD
jgi:hypothetical protein